MVVFLYVSMLVLGMVDYSSCNWCICISQKSDAELQKTLDYACGAGANCNLIQQNGACYNPNSVLAHCSYATNSFFQNKNQVPGTCGFDGTTQVVTTDPSPPSSNCKFPATPSGASSPTPPGSVPPPSITGAPPPPYGGGGSLVPPPPGTTTFNPSFVPPPPPFNGAYGGGNNGFGMPPTSDFSGAGLLLRHKITTLPWFFIVLLFLKTMFT